MIHSRSTLGIVCAVFMLCLCVDSMALPNPFKEKEGVRVVMTAPYVDIRTGPGRGFPITHVAERGETLRVFKRLTDWYKVETDDGVTGWVKSDVLNGSLKRDGSEAVFSLPAREAYTNRTWELGMALGDFSGAESLTMIGSYHMTRNLSAELKYTQAFGDFSNLKLLNANIVHQIWPEWRVSPFFTMGTGILQTSPNAGLVETIDREDNVFSVGGGFFIYLSRNFLLRAEYDEHNVLTSRNDNEEVNEWKMGFSVFF